MKGLALVTKLNVALRVGPGMLTLLPVCQTIQKISPSVVINHCTNLHTIKLTLTSEADKKTCLEFRQNVCLPVTPARRSGLQNTSLFLNFALLFVVFLVVRPRVSLKLKTFQMTILN